ncbi:MAG TPA: hypothetical protein VFE05_11110 [Longimicrobiaceae bacterium]|jgi:hypothetical protein|nr:hypothetical protein [Longimicrobiaceae bacterium]
MKKLSLKLDELLVESFNTSAARRGRLGTVRGQAGDDSGVPIDSAECWLSDPECGYTLLEGCVYTGICTQGAMMDTEMGCIPEQFSARCSACV